MLYILMTFNYNKQANHLPKKIDCNWQELSGNKLIAYEVIVSSLHRWEINSTKGATATLLYISRLQGWKRKIKIDEVVS